MVFLTRISKHLGKIAIVLVLANLPLLATLAELDRLASAKGNQFLKMLKWYDSI
jgi:hypothetical protein